MLINANANVNIQDDFGKSPLSTAIISGDKDIFLILLNSGVNVNIQDIMEKRH